MKQEQWQTISPPKAWNGPALPRTLTLDFKVRWQQSYVGHSNVTRVPIIEFNQHRVCILLLIARGTCRAEAVLTLGTEKHILGQLHCWWYGRKPSPETWLLIAPWVVFARPLTSDDIPRIEATRLLAPISTDPSARREAVTWLGSHIQNLERNQKL